MSIVRQGLAEDSKFAAGYEAIFGKGKGGTTEDKPAVKGGKKSPAKAKIKKGGGKKPAKKK